MSDLDLNTPPQDPVGTGGDTSPATPPQGSDGASDDTVTLSKTDYNNLVSSRDRSNNNLKELTDTVGDLQASQAYSAQERSVSKFLESNKDKYPDVSVEDLMGNPLSEDQYEEIAKNSQKKVDDVVQKRLMDVQRTNAPIMTPDERAAELKRMKENPKEGDFERMLELQSS